MSRLKYYERSMALLGSITRLMLQLESITGVSTSKLGLELTLNADALAQLRIATGFDASVDSEGNPLPLTIAGVTFHPKIKEQPENADDSH